MKKLIAIAITSLLLLVTTDANAAVCKKVRIQVKNSSLRAEKYGNVVR